MVVLSRSGGSVSRPTFACGVVNTPSIARTPSFALLRSVHAVDAPELSHIDPVRSTMTATSMGLLPHGLHAFALAETLKWSMPKIREK